MNVTIKPLVWNDRDGLFTSSAMSFTFSACKANRYEERWVAFLEPIESSFGDHETSVVLGHMFSTPDMAKMACERWYTARVLDCLEPADKATCAEFVTMYAQCNGDYD